MKRNNTIRSGLERTRLLLFFTLVFCSLISCSVRPCTSTPSTKEIFDLKARCNQLGADLDEKFVGQYASFDDDSGVELQHHVFLSHYNVQRDTCYVFLNRTYPTHFIEYVVDATSNKEELQATTNANTMKSIYRWYSTANDGVFFQVPQAMYLAKYEELMGPSNPNKP